ncbi:MAG: hypothetical protein DRJ05_14230 [Bacteroidetes bacterium]|nr:MAG: hypothetical protein DRJ05_14230 [Bacteroidota bacterium]
MICVDTGIYIITDYNGNSWEYHNFRAVDAISPGYGSDSLIVLMNEGGYSDGIYSYNIETGLFNVIDYWYKPNFILANNSLNQFYVGYENGLAFSEDGITWTDVAFFETLKCIDMEIENGNYVVSTLFFINNTFLSQDGGNNWFSIVGVDIFGLASHSNSGIYGVSPDFSPNCGLNKLNANNLEWENLFPSQTFSALGTDNMGIPFVGWHDGTPPFEGIAKYEGSDLVFYNDGLPNLNINYISSPMILGATVIYCCTDSGAFERLLSVGIQETNEADNLSVFPNPITNQATIKLNFKKTNGINNSISVYNNQGKIVDEIKTGINTEIIWDRGSLPSGIYYLVFEIRKERFTEKFIIL